MKSLVLDIYDLKTVDNEIILSYESLMSVFVSVNITFYLHAPAELQKQWL